MPTKAVYKSICKIEYELIRFINLDIEILKY